ncbi:MAG: YigZ family protein [Kangiellaceae bacterium]|jgi:uncharacterized YigZ family protein|nr:YigZ family protein [Kangiellaceae bacterium]
MANYSVPKAFVSVEESIKGSRFITRVWPVAKVEQAKQQLRQLRTEEPTATHHCWAYIVGDPNSTTLLGCSDDGEPAGTAGKPMLNVLQHSGLGDLLAVCTRYYGGTKLGTGGLARAYGGGVKLALEQVDTEEKIEKDEITISIAYDCAKDLEHELKQVDGAIDHIDYGEQLTYQVTVPAQHSAQLKQQCHIRFGDKHLWNTTV